MLFCVHDFVFVIVALEFCREACRVSLRLCSLVSFRGLVCWLLRTWFSCGFCVLVCGLLVDCVDAICFWCLLLLCVCLFTMIVWFVIAHLYVY